MFDFFNIEMSKLFKECEQEMFDLHHPYVGTEHLLLALLKTSSEIKALTLEYDLTYEKFKNELLMVVGSAKKKSSYVLYTPLLKRVIKRATNLAMENNEELTYKHFLMGILDEGEGIAIRVLIGMDIDIDAMYDDLMECKNKTNEKLEIFKVGKNLNALVDLNERLIGREKELNYMMETLMRKDKNNPLLIGPAGVGKTALVEELARLIEKNTVPRQLKNKKIIMLEMGSLVAGTKYRGEFEERLTKIIKELEKNKELILFIDEIHAMVNAGGAEGAINAADILKPYLARGSIKCIGATTTQEYNKFIASDKALARRFETINIIEPNEEETITILTKVKSNYEKHYNIKIKNKDIEKLVKLTNKYLFDKKNPDKALDVLDSVCSYLAIKKENNKYIASWEEKIKNLKDQKIKLVKENKFQEAIDIHEEIKNWENKIKQQEEQKLQSIKESDIYYVISKKINIPLPSEKKEMLKKLKVNLTKDIYGQEKAIEKVVNVLNNKFYDNSLPISFIFNGSSGVGKSYMAHCLSKYLKMKILKLDFADYTNNSMISKLIGTTAGYVGYNDEALFNNLKYNPYTIITIENYDLGCLEIKKLFDQIFEEGMIKNAKGEDISFKNTIIIINTNLKRESKVGFEHQQKNYPNKNLLDKVSQLIEFANLNQETVEKYLIKNHYNKELITQIDYQNGGFKTIIKALKNQKEVMG